MSDVDFTDDPAVQRCADRLLSALKAAATAAGYDEVTSLSIVTIAVRDGHRDGSVMHWGCDCTKCQINTIEALGRSHGATVELQEPPPCQPA